MKKQMATDLAAIILSADEPERLRTQLDIARRRQLVTDVGFTRMAVIVGKLHSALTDLARAADTAELLLKNEYPGEAASLRAKVTAAIDALKIEPGQ